MKVAVADLRPNPFRHLDHYPIDAEKVARLRASIRDTSFWDNILARDQKGVFEIAYGHHRLHALQQEMPDATVDIPVRPLDDAMMLKIMANENGEEWGGQTLVDLDTILAVRQYLIEHPEALPQGVRDTLAKSGHETPGAKVIAGFLGGIWTEPKVKNVLDIIVPLEKGEIDEEAVRTIPTTSGGREFVRRMRKQPVPIQRRAAAEIAKEENKREAVKRVAERHKVPVPKTDRPTLEFEQHLSQAAQMARKLRGVVVDELWPRRAVLRQNAWDAFGGLSDLHALRTVLDRLFTVNPRQAAALTRRPRNAPPRPRRTLLLRAPTGRRRLKTRRTRTK